MPGRGPSRLRVLIADDSSIIRDRLHALVAEQTEAEVVGPVSGGLEALHLLALRQPDAVILDLIMPGLGGLDVLPVIRRRHPECLIIVFTNHATDEFRNRCLQEGANFFLEKSQEFERIPEILEELARRQALSLEPSPAIQDRS